MQTKLTDWEGKLFQQPLSPESYFRATRLFIVPTNGHEIQQQHQVGGSRTSEAVVQQTSETATEWFGFPQLQQPLQQQPPQCQLQQRQQHPSWNDYDTLGGTNLNKKTHKRLFPQLCSYDNLLLASIKARKRKGKKQYVKDFEADLENNLLLLQAELRTEAYSPRPLKTFIVRDPKTRKISASNYRDRIVHHAICNLIQPIFERSFINDTFANRKGKGNKAILERFDAFIRKNENGYALKADIRHYFDTIDQSKLLEIIGRKIKDEKVMNLIKVILKNHKTSKTGKGMPLGNLTSQNFANIYLSELDYFVKHNLRAKYYLRYVDDFILLSKDKTQLEEWQKKINSFLENELRLKLHPDKTKIIPIRGGVSLVGFRIFRHHKLLKKSNARRIEKRIERFKGQLSRGETTKEHIKSSMAGWMGYAKTGNTFKLRNQINEEVNSICEA